MQAIEITKIMLQCKSIVGIRFSVTKNFFPWIHGDAERFFGTFSRWEAKKLKLSIQWDDENSDVISLHELLLPVYEFRLESYKNGKAPPIIRGAARVQHARETAEPKDVVSITYKDGAVEKTQEWEHVEPEARTTERNQDG